MLLHQAEQPGHLLPGRHGQHRTVNQDVLAAGPEKLVQRQAPGSAGGIQQGGLQGAESRGMPFSGGLPKQVRQGFPELRRRGKFQVPEGGNQGFQQEGQATREGFPGDEFPGHPFAVPRPGGVGGHLDYQVGRAGMRG